MGSIGGFLGAVTLRVRIVAIRIIVVWGVRIYRVQDDPEKMALDAEKQVARADKGFLGSFAAADDQKDTVGLHRKDDGIGGSHNRRRVKDNELVFAAELGDRIGELVGREQVRGIGRERSGGDGGKIGNGRVVHGDQVKAGSTG